MNNNQQRDETKQHDYHNNHQHHNLLHRQFAILFIGCWPSSFCYCWRSCCSRIPAFNFSYLCYVGFWFLTVVNIDISLLWCKAVLSCYGISEEPVALEFGIYVLSSRRRVLRNTSSHLPEYDFTYQKIVIRLFLNIPTHAHTLYTL
jgi:hypothetical protein